MQSGVAVGAADAARDAAAAVESARRSVERDSAAATALQLRARLRRNARDRSAILGLATIAAYSYDYAAADRGYRQLLGSETSPRDAYAVRARLGLATTARIRGQFLTADTVASRAAAEAHAVGDTAAEAAALLNLAAVSGRTRGRAARDSALDAASPLVAAVPSLQASYRCARATAATGVNPDDELRAGAEQAQRMGDHRTRGGCLFVLAQLQATRGSSRAVTFRLMDEALAEFRAVRDRAAAGNVLQYTGWFQTAQGSYGVAKINLEAAIVESTAAGDQNGIAWASSNLANLALRTGDPVTAGVYVDRAVRLFEAIADRPGMAGAVGLRGDLARATGDYAQATQAYTAALEHQRTLGNTIGMIGLHNGLADLALIDSNWAEAQRQLDASRQLARARNLTGWDQGLDSWFAMLALLRGNLEEAERLLLAVLQTSQLPYRRYVVQSRLAEVYARRGDMPRAAARLTAAMDTLDRWRAAQSDHDLRLAVFGIQESWADPDLGVASVLNAMAMNGRAEEAFALAERRRARDLLDHLLSADALRDDVPDTLAPRRTRPAAATTAELIAALPDERTAILEFVTGRRGEPTTLFVLTRAGLNAVSLAPIDSIAAPIANHVAMIESGLDATTLGRTLGSRILGPALSQLPAAIHRLVIIPDDVLHRVAFDALVLPDGRLAIERFAISISPSATTLRQLWALARPASPRTPTLVFADPAFAATAANTEPGGYARVFADAGGLTRLRYTADEARSIARVVPGANLRTRADASEAFLRGATLRDYRILHFATHAVVDERTQARTGLALSPGAGHDGFLGPGDLAALDLDADLVVLSACRTASGVVVRGEGLIGLTAPLIQAGARAVMATGWKVRDRSAAQLVAAVYSALARGLPAGDALREAKLAALRGRALPRDWAAFVLVGDPLVRPLPPTTARR